MNHGLKLHPDGTLELTMPKGKKVTRVLVCEAGTQNGKLYYPERDVPDTNVGNLVNRQDVIDVARKCPVKEVTPAYMLIDKSEIMTELMLIPSAEPRKKGKWIHDNPNTFRCSECNKYLDISCGNMKMNFCPNCEADVRGDSE